MSAIPYDSQTQDWETPEQEQSTKPGRPRRRWWSRKSAALAAVVTCAAGFYGGIRVEKSQLASTATAATPAAGTAATAQGAAGPGARAGFPGGGGAGGANASFGTVSSVKWQHDLPDRHLGQHGQGHALLRDQGHQKRDRLQGIGTAR